MLNAASLTISLAFAAAAVVPISAQVVDGADIIVVGKGSVTTSPDRANLIVEVHTDAPSPQSAAAENADKMTSVVAALGRIGYSASSITTVSYSVQPNYRYRDRTQEQTGYSATNAILIRVDRIDAVGSVLDTVLAAGATRIRSVRFESSRARELREQALEEAVADARRSAEVLARAAGGQLGNLVLLSTENPSRDYGWTQYPSDTEFGLMQLEMPTPVAVGDQVVSVVVYARWRFIGR